MPWWVPLVVAAAGAVAKNQSDQQKLREQNKLTDSMTQYRSGKAAEGRAAIEDYTKTLDPAARGEQLTGIQDELGRGLEASVDVTKAYERPQDFAGRISGAYADTRSRGKARTDDRLNRAIEQLRVISAPGQFGLQDSFGFSRAASKVDAANSGANYVSRAFEEAIKRARGNQALRRSGEVAQELGGSYGSFKRNGYSPSDPGPMYKYDDPGY